MSALAFQLHQIFSQGFSEDFMPNIGRNNNHEERKEEERKDERYRLSEIEKYSIRDEQYTNFEDITSKNLVCPICSCVIDGTVAITSCAHKFCSRCLQRHISTSISSSCPICRTELSANDLILSESETDFLENSIVTILNVELE